MSIREAKQPIRAQEILKFWRAINKRTLISPTPAGIFKRENYKQKIESVDSGYRDLGIAIKDIHVQKFSALGK